MPQSRSFPDNWIYIHATDVEVGRIQNFGSWSPYLVKDGRACLGLEYFVFEGDELWNKPDEDLIALGTKELDASASSPTVTSSGATSSGSPRRTRTTTSATRTTSR